MFLRKVGGVDGSFSVALGVSSTSGLGLKLLQQKKALLVLAAGPSELLGLG